MRTKILLAVLMTLAFAAAGDAQTLDRAKLDQFFDRLAEKNKAMGSLTIAKAGKPLYNRAIGYAQINGNEKKPLTAATRYRIGSITKMFTAAMVLQLAEEGKLHLTDTLDTFFPQIPNAAKITLAQLLAHRSGIREITEDRDFRAGRTVPRTPDQLTAFIARGKPEFAPGAKHSYNNSGYILLARIVEKASGKPYAQALKERIAAKVGLADTYPATGNSDPAKNEALSYRYLRDWEEETDTHASNLFGSGGMVSTPNDLARFIHALFDRKLISQESLNRMTRDGMGMDTFSFGGKTFYGHTGGIDNFGAWVAYLPEEKLAVAYTSNAKVYPVAKIMEGVLDIYGNRPFTIPTFAPVVVAPEVLDSYVGVYWRVGAPVRFIVTREGGTLCARLRGEPVPLEATAEDTFQIEGMGLVLTFEPENNRMLLRRDGQERLFVRQETMGFFAGGVLLLCGLAWFFLRKRNGPSR